MKLKLSEYITDEHMDARGMEDAEHAPDARAMARIRAAALRKAGFPEGTALPRPKRRAGRRLMVVLAAALVLAMALATALATTSLGRWIGEIFRDTRGYEGWLSALGTYGEPLESEDTRNDITIRVEAAYANDEEGVLILSFEDKLGRLEDTMNFDVNVATSGVNPSSFSSVTRTGASWQSEGRRYMIMSFDDDVGSFGGRNMWLTIDKMVPKTMYLSLQPTGMTLREALALGAPIPLPGLEKISFLGAEEEALGVAISAKYTEALWDEGPSGLSFQLRTPSGEVLDNERRGEVYTTDDDGRVEATTPMCGFLRPEDDREWQALLDSEIVYSYYQKAAPLEGKWLLNFRMPRGDRIISNHRIDQVVNLNGVDTRIDTAKVYHTGVVVDYRTLESVDNLHEEFPIESNLTDDSILFDERPDPFPGFRLVDDQGEEIPGSSFRMQWVGEDGSDGPSRYKATMHCLVDELPSIILEAINGETGDVLLSYRLK